MALKSINPYTGKTIHETPELSDKELDQKLSRSQEAFSSWRKTDFSMRKKLMLAAADHLEKNNDMLNGIITEEMGKTVTEARAEVNKCAWVCRHYAENAEMMLHKEAIATDAHLAFVRYDPLGTILGIMPWNFPFWQVFRFAAPTLMAGNTILLKHASNVQLSANAIESVFEHAGFPPGIFQNLPVSSKKAGQLIADDRVKAVTLTGSEKAGRSVAQAAGKALKKSVLELGGSNAFIVLDDADIDQAVETGVKARMQNAGQSCIAAKRFIVHEKVYDTFLDKFRTGIERLATGNPLDEKTELATLASTGQAEKVMDQLSRSVKQGAKVLTGGKPEKAFFPATLVTGVVPGMPLFDEEVFGPVAPVVKVKTTRDAIDLTNRSDFGLGVSLFTNDLEKAERLIPEFEDGAVFVNDLVKSDPRLPFGGTKRSGYGRELAVNGIREFVNVKTVSIEKLHEMKREKNEAVISTGGRPS